MKICSLFQKRSMTEPLGLQQTIFCTSQNQILNIIETALHTQDKKYGTPFQTISEMQSPFNNLGKDILTGQPHKNILYFRNRTLFSHLFMQIFYVVYICMYMLF